MDRKLLAWMRRSRGPLLSGEHDDVGKPVVHPDVDLVLDELGALGVRARFRFVWSGDGSGVEEDQPRVVHLHRALLRTSRPPPAVRAAAERVLSVDLASVVRHELGHALLFLRPRVARTRPFRRLFGDVSRAYRVGHPVAEVERRMRRHGGLANPRYRRVVSLYAATHPHEQFAEAIRIAIHQRGDEDGLAAWAERAGTAPIVGEQLRFAARWLRRWHSG